MRQWVTISREVVLDRTPWLVVENHRVRLPNGGEISDWAWVVAPEYVTIAAMTEQEEFLCFRQTKYSIEGTTLAPVAGYVEPGEPPVAAAQRELREETGYEAAAWIDMGSYIVDANRGVGRGHFFLAREARPIGSASPDDLEEQRLLLLTRDEVRAALVRGEFRVMAWSAVFALSLLHVDTARTK